MSTNKIIRVYGIANCDTVKKARQWLQERGAHVEFHDFKKLGVTSEQLTAWSQAVGWEKLTNRQGTTWRKLAPEIQASVQETASALPVLQAHTSLIKRPVVEWTNGRVSVGFQPAVWQEYLGS
ncbi:MAG: arsenate reductase [Comamonas sp.]